ncbi:hypothetical protein CsSME_00009623 [Camellia sinensis var. sinensis]
MQGQRSAGNSFTETVDLNQGFVSNNTGMNQSTAWNSMLSPVESWLPNYMLSFAEGNYTCTNASSSSSRVSLNINLNAGGMGSSGDGG